MCTRRMETEVSRCDAPTAAASSLIPASKGFDYTTQKIQVDPLMLDKDLLCSKSFHLICSPTRCIRIVKDILKRIAEEREEFEGLVPPMAPVFVWEPVPTSCKPQELSKVYEALKYVDVVSPNLMELQALFGNYVDSNKASTEEIASMSNTLLTSGFGNKPSAVIVRLGAEGCFVAQTFRHISMPAYHGNSRRMDGDELKTRENNVVDPTGAGNAFLGGFCVGLFDNSKILGLTDFEVAASYGSVAASFVVEQVGMPKRSYDECTKAELWNGEGAYDRLVEFVKRLPARTPLTDAQLRKSSLFEKYRVEGMFREEKQLESLENPRGLEY